MLEPAGGTGATRPGSPRNREDEEAGHELARRCTGVCRGKVEPFEGTIRWAVLWMAGADMYVHTCFATGQKRKPLNHGPDG